MLTFFTISINAKKVKSKVSLNYNTTGKCCNVCLEVQKPKKNRFWTRIYALCCNAMRQIKAIQNPFYVFINLKLLSLHEITILCWITWISSIIAACSTTGLKLNGVTKDILLQSSMGHEKNVLQTVLWTWRVFPNYLGQAVAANSEEKAYAQGSHIQFEQTLTKDKNMLKKPET